MLSRSTIRQKIPFLAIGGLYLDVVKKEEVVEVKLDWFEDIVLPCIDVKNYISDEVLLRLKLMIEDARDKVFQQKKVLKSVNELVDNTDFKEEFKDPYKLYKVHKIITREEEITTY